MINGLKMQQTDRKQNSAHWLYVQKKNEKR